MDCINVCVKMLYYSPNTWNNQNKKGKIRQNNEAVKSYGNFKFGNFSFNPFEANVLCMEKPGS